MTNRPGIDANMICSPNVEKCGHYSELHFLPSAAAELSDYRDAHAKMSEAVIERHRFDELGKRELKLPKTVAELRAAFEKKSEELAIESPQFGDLMRLLVPEFNIYLVRLIDGGHLMPRARVKLNLAGCVSDLLLVPELSGLLTRVVTLDLFEAPQRERIRVDAVRLAATGLYQREIARQLPEKTFQVVVQKALNLDRMMKERGLKSPYEVLSEPPVDYPKLRRHKHPRYEFKRLEGYEPPAI
jgi:site-specific DNA recombinase